MKYNVLFNPLEHVDIHSYLKKYGITDTAEYINPSGKYFENPFDYVNMNEGIDMFLSHVNDKTIIVEDGDVDGLVSATIIYQYMKKINPNWDIIILRHKGKERGIDDEDVFNDIIENNPKFVIIPDAGSNSVDKTREVSNLGIDVLVLDHHNIETPIQNGILINNQIGNVDKFGSGALVTHMFLKGVDKRLSLNYSDEYIDLVSLSIISDSMDVRSLQNRAYLYYGVMNYNNIRNGFLKFLIDTYIKSEKYTQKKIAFNIVPLLNSVIRSESIEDKTKLFLALCDEIDYNEVSKMCNDYHGKQIVTIDKTISHIFDLGLDTQNNIIVVNTPEIPKSYNGLIAGKLASKFNKIVLVGKSKDGEFLGSVRSPYDSNKELFDSGYINWVRGHEKAYGFSMDEKDIPNLIDYYAHITPYEPSIDVLFDARVNYVPSYIFGQFGADYDDIWGNMLPYPNLYIETKFIPSEVKILGKNKRTLKLISDKNDCNCMIFNCLKEDKVNLKLGNYENDTFVYNPQKSLQKFVGVGKPNINVYNGMSTNQIIIDKYDILPFEKTLSEIF